MWAIVLEAADGNPLLAQEMDEKMTQEWWDRYLAYRNEKGKAESRKKRK